MPGKKDKSDAAQQPLTQDDAGEYKTRENLKIKELLKKQLTELKVIDEKFKSKINQEMSVKVDSVAVFINDDETQADFFTRLARKALFTNEELNEAH